MTARAKLTEADRLAALEQTLARIRAKFAPPHDVAGLLAWSQPIDSPDTAEVLCEECGQAFISTIVEVGKKAGQPLYTRCKGCRPKQHKKGISIT